MKLLYKIDQFRRDFSGVYSCENCSSEEEKHRCYDDSFFHEQVTPTWKCKSCGKSSLDLGVTIEKIKTRYNQNEIV